MSVAATGLPILGPSLETLRALGEPLPPEAREGGSFGEILAGHLAGEDDGQERLAGGATEDDAGGSESAAAIPAALPASSSVLPPVPGLLPGAPALAEPARIQASVRCEGLPAGQGSAACGSAAAPALEASPSPRDPVLWERVPAGSASGAPRLDSGDAASEAPAADAVASGLEAAWSAEGRDPAAARPDPGVRHLSGPRPGMDPSTLEESALPTGRPSAPAGERLAPPSPAPAPAAEPMRREPARAGEVADESAGRAEVLGAAGAGEVARASESARPQSGRQARLPQDVVSGSPPHAPSPAAARPAESTAETSAAALAVPLPGASPPAPQAVEPAVQPLVRGRGAASSRPEPEPSAGIETTPSAPAEPAAAPPLASSPEGPSLPSASPHPSGAEPAPLTGGPAALAGHRSGTAASAALPAPEGASAAGALPAPVDALPAHVQWLAERGGGSARLELHPPHLGRVDISVRTRGSQVEVSIVVHEPAAHTLVQAHRDLFSDALSTRSLELTGFRVGSGELSLEAGMQGDRSGTEELPSPPAGPVAGAATRGPGPGLWPVAAGRPPAGRVDLRV